MKRILATVLVVCLLIVPIKAFADSPTEDATASLLTERNQALTTYLSDNLTERAVYDPEWRAQLIQDFSPNTHSMLISPVTRPMHPRNCRL